MKKAQEYSIDIVIEPSLDRNVENNFKKVNYRLLIVPFSLLFLFFCFFAFSMEGTFVDTYVKVQKNLFLELNSILSIYPYLAYNITYLGNAIVIFPFVFIFLITAPKFWEVLLTSSLFTLITSAILKIIFAVPRPAAIIDMSTFTIIGRPNILHTSLPSGHSMTAFMVITVLLYAFMPKKNSHKLFWSIALITIGLTIAFSRVAIGAHYPLDVVLGSILGYIITILSVKINNHISWLNWMKNRRFYPIIMFILSIWAYLIILKIIKYNLVVFYLSFIALAVTFLVILNKYVKESKA
ncbi:MAG: phosphatase PAP2 family protein [Ignavibacteriae bacterium]|nr:phosphatase PAP2 family protein [Gelidibacter sp.]MCB0746125.1 phosphatase PAP2 family protein [Ignavibacteriota bacterium]